jgi:cell filamentation protein
MKARPGEIMGYLAYGHPFLDGNGRTIMTVHSVLAQRAGFSIDWSATTKDAYLDALTKEIENPPKGHLDAYLKPFMRDPIAYEQLATAIVRTPGLDGSLQGAALNEVLGRPRNRRSRRSTKQCSRSGTRPRFQSGRSSRVMCGLDPPAGRSPSARRRPAHPSIFAKEFSEGWMAGSSPAMANASVRCDVRPGRALLSAAT